MQMQPAASSDSREVFVRSSSLASRADTMPTSSALWATRSERASALLARRQFGEALSFCETHLTELASHSCQGRTCRCFPLVHVLLQAMLEQPQRRTEMRPFVRSWYQSDAATPARIAALCAVASIANNQLADAEDLLRNWLAETHCIVQNREELAQLVVMYARDVLAPLGKKAAVRDLLESHAQRLPSECVQLLRGIERGDAESAGEALPATPLSSAPLAASSPSGVPSPLLSRLRRLLRQALVFLRLIWRQLCAQCTQARAQQLALLAALIWFLV